MTCEEIRVRIEASLDGELDPEERAAVRVHLEGCRGCSAEADALRATLDLLPRRYAPQPDTVASLAREVGALRRRVGDLERQVRALRTPARARLGPMPLVPHVGEEPGLRLIG